MGLPGNFHDEADGHAGVLVGAAEGVHDVEALVAAKLLLGQVAHDFPGLLGHGMVVVLVALGGPPDGVLGVLVHDDVLVLGGTAGVDAGHDVHGAQLGLNTHVIAGEGGVHLGLVQVLVGGVVDDFGGAGNAVLGQIDIRHNASYLFR